MKTYLVTLKDGSDYLVMGKSEKDAIKRVHDGKGKHQGSYFKSFRKDKAVPLKELK